MVKKMPAYNERFHASGGVARPTLRVEQQPPLSSEPYLCPRLREAATTLCATDDAASSKIKLGWTLTMCKYF